MYNSVYLPFMTYSIPSVGYTIFSLYGHCMYLISSEKSANCPEAASDNRIEHDFTFLTRSVDELLKWSLRSMNVLVRVTLGSRLLERQDVLL